MYLSTIKGGGMDKQWTIYLFGAILLALSLYNAWKVIRLYRIKTASAAWILTAGEVLSKYVSTNRDSDGSKSYRAIISYTYTVLGNEFERKLSRGSLWGKRGAEKILAGIGDTLEVRYNPQKPDEHITGLDKIGVSEIFSVVMPVIVVLVLVLIL